jgi:hypothetical protein
MMGGLFRLRYVTIVGYFYYLILLKLLHVSVVRPSSGGNIFARIYSTDNGSVVFRTIKPKNKGVLLSSRIVAATHQNTKTDIQGNKRKNTAANNTPFYRILNY